MDTLMELLQAQAGDEEAQGFTTKEVMKMLDCGEDNARAKIKGLIEDGKVCPARVRRVNMAGVSTMVIGYKLN